MPRLLRAEIFGSAADNWLGRLAKMVDAGHLATPLACTCRKRLRDARVVEDERTLPLGRAINRMPQHHATATIARVVDAVNKVQETHTGPSEPKISPMTRARTGP